MNGERAYLASLFSFLLLFSTFRADYDAVWEAALKALAKADIPVSIADRDRGEIASSRHLRGDEIHALAFFPTYGRDFLWGLGQLRLNLKRVDDKVRVEVSQRVTAYTTFHRGFSFLLRSRRPVPLKLPEYIEGRSLGVTESYLLKEMEGLLR